MTLDSNGRSTAVTSTPILVVGEALVDIVPTTDGARDLPGGSPANVAVTLGRLGRPVRLATVLADDLRGRAVRAWLEASNVEVTAYAPASGRTSTAAVRLADDGGAAYDFDLAWDLPQVPAVDDAEVLHVGSIATVLDPGAAVVESAMRHVRGRALVTFDPNARPAITPDVDAVRAHVERLVAISDVVKVSEEDLRWYYPGTDPVDAALAWASSGAALVVLTLGGEGSVIVRDGTTTRIDAPRVEVADTIGAGDTFMGALLDALVAEGITGARARARLIGLPLDRLKHAVTRAAAAAAITVSRPGANPPTRAELESALAGLSPDDLLWRGGPREGQQTPIRRRGLALPAGDLRLGAWVAPAVFGAVPGGSMPVVDVTGECLELRIGLRRHGRPFAVLRVGDARVELDGDTRVRELGWTRLDLFVETTSRAGGVARLLVDGDTVASATTGVTALSQDSDRTLDVVIGGEGDAWYGWFVGVLGPVWLTTSDKAAPPCPVTDPAEAWRVRPDAYGRDLDRPTWHFLPPRHWMNEPHGVLHHHGRHHLFYQRNELGPFWGEISWGHAVSTDLVRWTDLGHALAPWDVPCAPDGVWSGSSALDDTGSPVLFFTAGDMRDTPNQRTAFARPADVADPDLRRWTVSAPVTTATQATARLASSGLTLLPGEFRDPFVWREAGTWFQIVGAGMEDRGGTALLFRCDDPEPINWTFVGPLAIGDAGTYPETGVMWELPVLLPIGTGPDGLPRHLLVVTPWWPRPTRHSLLYAWYWIGIWDPSTATWSPEHAEPRSLDHGGWLTGVTGSVHPDGRTLLWSITQDLLGDDEHRRRRWAGNAGVPLQVSYADGGLHVAPIDEITSLRTQTAVDAAIGPDSSLDWDAGPNFDLEADLRLPPGASIRLALRGGAAILTLERRDGHILRTTVERPGAREPHRELRTWDRMLDGDVVALRVLVDHSMVEAFIAGQPVTTRAWAGRPDGERCRVESQGATATHVRVHVLDAAPVSEDRTPR